jgi:NitT/TauT family transport system substrate-binding protein
MGERNREMDAETFRLGAEAQAPLIETELTREHGLGAMSRERWATLAGQLEELGLIEQRVDPAACFVALP